MQRLARFARFTLVATSFILFFWLFWGWWPIGYTPFVRVGGEGSLTQQAEYTPSTCGSEG